MVSATPESDSTDEIWRADVTQALRRLENNQNEMMSLLRQLLSSSSNNKNTSSHDENKTSETKNEVETIISEQSNIDKQVRGILRGGSLGQVVVDASRLERTLPRTQASPSNTKAPQEEAVTASESGVATEEQEVEEDELEVASSGPAQRAPEKPVFALPLERLKEAEALPPTSPMSHPPSVASAPITPGRVANPAAAQSSPRPQPQHRRTPSKQTPRKERHESLPSTLEAVSVSSPPSLVHWKKEDLWTSPAPPKASVVTGSPRRPPSPLGASRVLNVAEALEEEQQRGPIPGGALASGEKTAMTTASVVSDASLKPAVPEDPHSVKVREGMQARVY